MQRGFRGGAGAGKGGGAKTLHQAGAAGGDGWTCAVGSLGRPSRVV